MQSLFINFPGTRASGYFLVTSNLSGNCAIMFIRSKYRGDIRFSMTAGILSECRSAEGYADNPSDDVAIYLQMILTILNGSILNRQLIILILLLYHSPISQNSQEESLRLQRLLRAYHRIGSPTHLTHRVFHGYMASLSDADRFANTLSSSCVFRFDFMIWPSLAAVP